MSVSLEQLLYQGLINTPAFTSLLAVDAGGNFAFYDKQLPQQNFPASGGSGVIYPAGTYNRISSPRTFAHGATPQGNVGLARFQLTFWSNAINGTVQLNAIDQAVRAFFGTFTAMAGSPAFANPSFVSYNSQTGIEPQTQPTLQKLIVNVQFWFSDQI